MAQAMRAEAETAATNGAERCCARTPVGPAAWARRAMAQLLAEQAGCAETPVLRLTLPALPGIQIALKDEQAHPTGSLKHRLARSLMLYGLCNGRIGPDTPIIEASSGSTAVSVAWFAHSLGLPFHAVVPAATSATKLAAIAALGGHCHLVARGDAIYGAAQALADQLGGVYLDQFTYAERVSDWRRDNVAAALFAQLDGQAPDWLVMSLGTGGTAATMGRFIRYQGHATRLCCVDVERSAYFEGFETGDRGVRCDQASRIEGVGRPRVEPSFVPEVIDEMIKAPDTASIAAMRVLSDLLGRTVGASTGTNFLGVVRLAERMAAAGQTGLIASLICDGGERYAKTYHDDAWLAAQGLDIAADQARLRRAVWG